MRKTETTNETVSDTSALQTSDTSNERCTVYVLQEIFSYSMYWCKCCISIQVLYVLYVDMSIHFHENDKKVNYTNVNIFHDGIKLFAL